MQKRGIAHRHRAERSPSMNCPLIMAGWNAARGGDEAFEPDCLQEECAWWDDGHPGCSILTIAQELAIKRQKEEVEL